MWWIGLDASNICSRWNFGRGGEVNYGAIVSKYMTFILRTTYMGAYFQKRKLDTEEMPMPGLNPMLCQTYVVH